MRVTCQRAADNTVNLPRRYITALLHEGTEREPEAVEQRKVTADHRARRTLVDLALVRTESTDDRQTEADADVRQHDAQPDVIVQRVHEGEDPRLLLLRLFDHDADTEVHERLREVDDSLAFRGDRQRRYRYVCLLHHTQRNENSRLKREPL